jgi:gluconate 2-dehydrogenase gamma chain
MMDRREFLTILACAVATARAAGGGMRSAVAAEMMMAPGPAPGSAAEGAYTFFTDPEVTFVKAAVARLIPADDLGPGAVEADVPYFIDQQLAGAYGAGAHFYNQGPFGSETPYQGYQLPLSPAELYRVGIAATDKYCEQKYAKRFAALDAATQDEVLSGLQGIAGDVDLKEIPGTAFFARLLGDTMDGFFADPAYGGNKNLAGWKLVGFPGVAYNYSDALSRYNQPYQTEPVGMRSLRQAELSPEPPTYQRADASGNQPNGAGVMVGATDTTYVWKSAQRFFV